MPDALVHYVTFRSAPTSSKGLFVARFVLQHSPFPFQALQHTTSDIYPAISMTTNGIRLCLLTFRLCDAQRFHRSTY